MSGSVPIAYIDMANGSPWVVSSLERIASPSINNDYSWLVMNLFQYQDVLSHHMMHLHVSLQTLVVFVVEVLLGD